MTDFFDFVFRHGLALLVGTIPSLACLVLVIFATSWRRWLAVALMVATGAILVFEFYNGSLDGNLTGLIWMLSTPLVAIAIAVLSLLEWSFRNTNHANKSSGPDTNHET